jgi:hypothetical protein
MINIDEPVFVVDLTDAEMRQCEAELALLAEGGRPPVRTLPDEPPTPIRWLALVIEGRDAPLLLPLEPTRDVVFLDALARIIRIAVLSGERLPTVAIEHGGDLERSLSFGRELPGWAYEGIDPAIAAGLPHPLRVVLEPRISSRSRPRRFS